MKMSLIMFAMLSLSSAAFARDKECPKYLEKAKQDVITAQQNFEEGTGTYVAVLGAKLAQADVFHACSPWVKYKYCERRITLLNSMIERYPGLIDGGQATQGDLDGAKESLRKTIYYCTHPAADHI